MQSESKVVKPKGESKEVKKDKQVAEKQELNNSKEKSDENKEEPSTVCIKDRVKKHRDNLKTQRAIAH